MRGSALVCALALAAGLSPLGAPAVARAQEESPPGPPGPPPPPPPGYGESATAPPPSTPPPGVYPSSTQPSQGYYPTTSGPYVRGPQPVMRSRPEPSGVHLHDGFMLRATIGGGYAQASSDDLGDISLRGGAFTLSLAIGGAVAEDFVLYADLLVFATADPRIESDGLAGDIEDTRAYTGGGLGIGLSRYWMPANVHLSVAIATLGLTFESDVETLDSDVGVGFDLAVGKEWWVGNQWGLGVALTSLLGFVPFSDSVLFSLFSLGIAGTVTYQ